MPSPSVRAVLIRKRKSVSSGPKPGLILESNATLLTVSLLVLVINSPGMSAPVPLQAVPGTTLDRCDELVRDHPDENSSYECYLNVARREKNYLQAAARLKACITFSPGSSLAYFYLGKVLRENGDQASATAFAQAAMAAAAAGNGQGQIWSLMEQAYTLGTFGKRDEADPVLDRALDVAVEEENLILIAQVETALGWQRFYQNRFAEATKFLLKANAVLFPDAPSYIQYNNLDGLAALAWAMGRHKEALGRYREIMRRFGGQDAYRDAMLRRNMALAASKLLREGLISQEELRAIQVEALQAAVATGNRLAEVGLRYLLGGSDRSDEGLRQIRLGLATARELGHVRDICWGLNMLADRTHARNPEAFDEAMTYADEAVLLATRSGERMVLPHALTARAALLSQGGKIERYKVAVVEALDALDRVRNLQMDRDLRSRLFDHFGHVFDSLASTLMQHWIQQRDESFLWLAVEVVERERARVLLDTLDMANITGNLSKGHPAVYKREQVLQAIAVIQNRLIGNEITDPARDEMLEQLSREEQKELELREEIARDDPVFAAVRAPEFATIDEMQSELGLNQVLLLFRVADGGDNYTAPDDGGSWLLCITATAVNVFSLPDRRSLERQIRMYLALLERGDRSDRDAAASLFESLLADLVEFLPPEVDEWIVIPDGILHYLPLDTLAPAGSETPVGLRYAISTVPSGTAWLRWQTGAALSVDRPVESRVFGVADPVLPRGDGAGLGNR